jgi:hypothetical protein
MATGKITRKRAPLTTPDGRYIVVRGRLWRTSNPNLDGVERRRLVDALMDARRAVGAARRSKDEAAQKTAHAAVDRAKRGSASEDRSGGLMARPTSIATWRATHPTLNGLRRRTDWLEP